MDIHSDVGLYTHAWHAEFEFLLTFINWEILLQTPKFPAFGGALLRSREDSRLIPLYALGGEAWLSPRGSGAVTRAPWLPSEPPLNYPPPSPRPLCGHVQDAAASGGGAGGGGTLMPWGISLWLAVGFSVDKGIRQKTRANT